ncbi:MAG: hypothetical protein JWO02_34 [Solirubrobacterales bacterium]|nr:hypothetical protein [Solirubrobacterales bacterium]
MATIGPRKVSPLPPPAGGLPLAPRRPSPMTVRWGLLAALTFSSGAVDAISFLGLGGVFTAFMTGNVVFLGLHIAGTGTQDAVRVCASLAAFGAGVALSVPIARPSRGRHLWSRGVSMTLGVAVLAQAGFLAVWVATAGRPSTSTGDLLVALSALAMGLQSGAVRALRVAGVFTTAATATVILLMIDVATWSQPASERRRLAAVLGGLLAGSVAGALLLLHARSFAPAVPLITTVLVIVTASRLLEAPDSSPEQDGP